MLEIDMVGLLLAVLIFYTGGTQSPFFELYIALVIGTGALLGWRTGTLVAVLSILTLGIFRQLMAYSLVPLSVIVINTTPYVVIKGSILIATFVISMLVVKDLQESTSSLYIQLLRLNSLRKIDQAISSTLNKSDVLEVVLGQAISQLKVDAAVILLLNSSKQEFAYTAFTGFKSQHLAERLVPIQNTLAGRALKELRVVKELDIEAPELIGYNLPKYAQDDFRSYLAAPMIANGIAIGVIEVFQKSKINPDQQWLEFFESLAGQAAIALDNAMLFENTQLANVELRSAYDATLAGWVAALDLRDRETEKHTRRVTEMTVTLAGAMGVNESELVHIKRGALLHDIGKMGIPDLILQKPGPLTEDEWVVMRNHPQYAFNFLSAVAYLRPALDIPHLHHEKWDGTGYPQGLKGEQIPFAARIFSVIDVWDALTSDRPYRKAWSKKKTLSYISEQSGTHFDPQVVDAFVKLMKSN